MPSDQLASPSSRNAAEDFQRIPEELRALPQWVCWKLETVGERLTKTAFPLL